MVSNLQIKDLQNARDFLLSVVAGAHRGRLFLMMSKLTDQQWTWVYGQAKVHRLLPQLHNAIAETPGSKVPEFVRSGSHNAFKQQALATLVDQKTINEIANLFDRAQIPYCALKGIPLTLRSYPHAALRPLRDIDVLVPRDRAVEAFKILQSNGCQTVPGYDRKNLSRSHQMPVLLAPSGVAIEVHFSVAPYERPGSTGLAEKLLSNAESFEVGGYPVRVANPTDNFVHLVLHAGPHHLFDNGPLTLSDLRALLASGELDWDKLEVELRALRLYPTFCLLLAMLIRFGGLPTSFSKPEFMVDKFLVEQAADLMTQQPEVAWQRDLLRRHPDFLERLLNGFGRALKPSAQDLINASGTAKDGAALWLVYPKWLFAKARGYLAASRKSDLDIAAANDTVLLDWIEGKPQQSQEPCSSPGIQADESVA
ncbi:MAG: nucleotidyltransferase family protein [Pseudomonadota bacterium]